MSERVEFEVGDVVRLRSGGFPMTVTNVTAGMRRMDTVWFGPDGKVRSGAFDKAYLEKTDERTPTTGS